MNTRIYLRILGAVVMTLTAAACSSSSSDAGPGATSSSSSGGGASSSSSSGGVGGSTIQDTDLTGTWLLSTESREFKDSTGEHLSSSFVKERYILQDTQSNGVQYDRCHEYGRLQSPYGIKTAERFYMWTAENGFLLEDDGSLKQQSTEQYGYSPGRTFEVIQTLTRVSDRVEISGGSLILNGPVAVNEQSHLCLWSVSSSVGFWNTLELMANFHGEKLSLRLEFDSRIAEGAYTYSDYSDDTQMKIDVHSNGREFSEIVGSNILDPRDVTIELSEYTDQRMVGSFSFTGQDDAFYTGEFVVLFEFLEH